jgi:hypothetical protein
VGTPFFSSIGWLPSKAALGELRATIGQHAALMAVKWEIDVETISPLSCPS